MSQALYRKYRSRSFDELVGQEHVTRTLKGAIKQGKLSHAYLFTGPRGTGKTSIARILAHLVNELEYSDTPHLDIVEIDAASNRRIEDVRDLREKVHIAPVSAKYKVYIIDEVHMLTTESFNALLKTLEEPPSHVIFILATTELHKLPATITSRTQRFAFVPPSRGLIGKHLTGIAKKESIAIADAALELIAEHGDGSFRDSISLLDQISSVAEDGKTITEKDVELLLGLPPKATLGSLLEAVGAHQLQKTIELIKALDAVGVTAAATALGLIRLILQKQEISSDTAELLNKLTDINRSAYPAAKLLAVLLTTASKENSGEKPAKPPRSVALAAPVDTTFISMPRQSADTSKTEAPVQKPAPKPAPIESTATTFKLSAIIEAWGTILEVVKKHSPPLFGTLKTAELRQHDSGALLLAFKYALHSKKLEDTKHRLVLTSAVQDATGITLTIECTIDPASEPTPLNKTALPANSEASAVMAMMGGGEMVEAA